jgi:multiple antibiotic resistance protein
VSLFSIALTFFLVTNPIGNSPAILALVKDFDFERQKKIMVREGVFALLLALFFQYFGELFYAVTLTGGTILFLTSLMMIFPKQERGDSHTLKQEPFFVPIATPLLSGAGLLTIIMLYSKQENNDFLITGAILLAWVGVLGVMAGAPYIQRIFGPRGMLALEQLMGMVLALISIEMIVKGSYLFSQTLSS